MTSANPDLSPDLWFDVSQTIVHFGRYGKATGIERVTCCMLAAMRRRPELKGRAYLYCIDPLTGGFHEIDWAFLDLVAESADRSAVKSGLAQPYQGQAQNAAPHWLLRRIFELMPHDLQPAARQLALAKFAFLRALAHVLRRASRDLWGRLRRQSQSGSFRARLAALRGPARDPARGSVLVNCGVTWASTRHTGTIARLKKERGILYVLMVHDIIGQSDPDFFPSYFQAVSRDWLLRNLDLAERVLAISDYTKSELLRWCGKMRPRLPDVRVIPLAQDLPAQGGEPLLPPALAGPFALFVSTLDPRKNHQLLFETWKRLYAVHGDRTPKLVLVGNRGWAVDDLINRLESAGWFGGHVIWYANADDAFLRALYRGCRFTIYPSLAEGWGLPIGESLAFGKPVIASNRTSIPEVGGDFVEYFDPSDGNACYALTERYCFDDAHVEARGRLIREKFVPRSWDDVALNVSAHLAPPWPSAGN